MTMGIVNAGMLGIDDLEPELREKVEDVVLNRHPNAGEALVDFAQTVKEGKAKDTGRIFRGASNPSKSAWNTR
jgi:5-methyltetrahydrofolate--homocysteine methyltransferase